jgi:phenylalanyl-tRNA synthetase alpha chain
MTLEEKVGKTLAELGATDAPAVEALFAEARRFLEQEVKDHERWASQPPDALRVRWLGRKKSMLAQIDEHWLKAAPKELKTVAGREFNQLKKKANEEISLNLEQYGIYTVRPTRPEPTVTPVDITLPGYRRPLGSIHPVTRVLREIEDIFLGLGFTIETGPEVETVYYNFDALNIPESHPARDDWDTLYVDEHTVLRTHTSPVQIRAMENGGAPLYIIVPGKVYRHDNPDSSHATMFHQIEGLAVDRDITFADLKGTLDFFAKKFFGERVRTRFSPSFFPFTEPSGEVSINCVICDGQGCRTCKDSGWVEVMGCGMVHPEVLRHGGIDPEQYTGWAFGLGVERYAMMKYGIHDIQLFCESDVRFLEQFS